MGGIAYLVVSYGDLVLCVAGRHGQYTVNNNVEVDHNMWNTSLCWCNFSTNMIVLSPWYNWLLTAGWLSGVCGEGHGLPGGNGSVPLKRAGHIKRQGSRIQK